VIIIIIIIISKLIAGHAPHPRVPLTLPLAVVMLMLATCSSDSAGDSSSADPANPTEPITPRGSESSTRSSAAPTGTSNTGPVAGAGETPVRITLGGTVINGRLSDNPTARDLVARLPLSLSFRDFNGVEKVAELPGALTMEGVPPGDDPEIGDIGYYQPTGDLVLYYGDVGYWRGIVRLGHMDADMELIRRQPDGARVTIERST
jgi:hypothetical protein